MSGELIAIVAVGATLAGLADPHGSGENRNAPGHAEGTSRCDLRERGAELEVHVAQIETALAIPRSESPVSQIP